jgi:hypothetical protein
MLCMLVVGFEGRKLKEGGGVSRSEGLEGKEAAVQAAQAHAHELYQIVQSITAERQVEQERGKMLELALIEAHTRIALAESAAAQANVRQGGVSRSERGGQGINSSSKDVENGHAVEQTVESLRHVSQSVESLRHLSLMVSHHTEKTHHTDRTLHTDRIHQTNRTHHTDNSSKMLSSLTTVGAHIYVIYSRKRCF